VLPAGTGHKRLAATDDLLVIGAYPPGQEGFDLRTGELDELAEVTANIVGVPLPQSDPTAGPAGPLVALWQDAAARAPAS
jgi:uncharacterized protein YjlB